jgi:integrase
VRIEQRGNRWRCRVWNGSGVESSQSFGTKTAAERWGREQDRSRDRGEWIDPAGGKVLFAKWVETWKSTTVNLRISTRARDDSYLESLILPRFRRVPLAGIDHMMVRAWVAQLSGSGRAPATVQKAGQILGKIMRAAVDAELISRNPVERVAFPRVERVEMRHLTARELTKLANTIDDRYRAWVLVAGYGGLRAAELFGLRRHRVDLVRGTVDVAEICVEVSGHHHFGPPKTRAGRRVVPLPGFVVAELAEHLERVDVAPKGLVFPAPKGGPVRLSLFRRRTWQPAVEAAGLSPLRIHDLRHTAISLWIEVGASPKGIAVRAGHTSTSVVLDRYGHLLPDSSERVTAALDALGR